MQQGVITRQQGIGVDIVRRQDDSPFQRLDGRRIIAEAVVQKTGEVVSLGIIGAQRDIGLHVLQRRLVLKVCVDIVYGGIAVDLRVVRGKLPEAL